MKRSAHKKTTVILATILVITLCSLVTVSSLYLALESRLRELEADYERLKALTETLREYFFFQDVEFLNDNSWALYIYSLPDPSRVVDSFVNYTNGCAHGLYYVTDGGCWGGAQFLQGQLPHGWRSGGSILGGTSLENAKPVAGVTFYREFPIPEGTFFFNARVKVLQRNYATFGNSDWAYANIAPQFTFAYDDRNYDDPDVNHSVAINVELHLSQVRWDRETKTLTHMDNAKYNFSTDWDGDYHIGIIVDKIVELNEWYTFKIDMKDVIDTVFSFTSAEKITFKAIIIGNDGTSSYSEAICDYAYMSVEN